MESTSVGIGGAAWPELERAWLGWDCLVHSWKGELGQSVVRWRHEGEATMSLWARARARAPQRGKGEAQPVSIAGAQRRGEGVEVVNIAENIVGVSSINFAI